KIGFRSDKAALEERPDLRISICLRPRSKLPVFGRHAGVWRFAAKPDTDAGCAGKCGDDAPCRLLAGPREPDQPADIGRRKWRMTVSGASYVAFGAVQFEQARILPVQQRAANGERERCVAYGRPQEPYEPGCGAGRDLDRMPALLVLGNGEHVCAVRCGAYLQLQAIAPP